MKIPKSKLPITTPYGDFTYQEEKTIFMPHILLQLPGLVSEDGDHFCATRVFEHQLVAVTNSFKWLKDAKDHVKGLKEVL